jgi:hypothetical protein
MDARHRCRTHSTYTWLTTQLLACSARRCSWIRDPTSSYSVPKLFQLRTNAIVVRSSLKKAR